MKKLLVLLILLPLAVSAKFYKATVTLNDGTIKVGLVELPEYPDDATIKFKTELKSKAEALSSSDVSSFEVTNEKKEQIKFITIIVAEAGTFNRKKITVGTKKSWLRVIKEGKISLYSGHAVYDSGAKTGGATLFYIKREHNDYALLLDESSDGGLTFVMNGFSNLKSIVKSYFEEDCPKLHELLTKEDLKKNGYVHIVDLYEQNCGK